jgi:HK97 family phage prohead protease
VVDTLIRPPRPTAFVVDRADLIREVSFRLAGDTGEAEPDGRTIDGYGAVFNVKTRISSWEGEFDEEILPGAFRKSIRERTPVMQYDHGRHPLIGSIPLGRWDVVEEDPTGLHVVGRLSDNWLIQPVRDAIAGPDGTGGGITGMSFRFSVVRDKWTDNVGKTVKDDELLDMLWYGAGDRGPLLRQLQEVKTSEVGPVAWPAYDATSVGVRSTESPFIVDLGSVDLRTESGRSKLARAVALADRAAPRPPSDRERLTPPCVDTTSGEGQGGARGVDTATITGIEPQATARPAGTHSPEPRATEVPTAGEHSPRKPARRDRHALAATIAERTRDTVRKHAHP